MDITWIKLKYLIEESGKDDKEIERDLMLPKNSIYNWNYGITKSYMKYLDRFAPYFRVSLAYLMGETDDRTPIRRKTETGEDRAQTLASLFEKLTPEDQKFFEDMMQLRLDQQSNK